MSLKEKEVDNDKAKGNTIAKIELSLVRKISAQSLNQAPWLSKKSAYARAIPCSNPIFACQPNRESREEAIKFAHAIRRPDLIETIRFVDSFPQLTLL